MRDGDSNLINVKKPKMRILLVEDSHERFAEIERMLPEDARTVWTCCGATAKMVLDLDRGETYAGIMLDFDLDQSLYMLEGPKITGEDVARKLIQTQSKDTPILVHSMNPHERQKIVHIVESAGFSVTQVPFSDLNKKNFGAWLEECRGVCEDRDEN